MTARLDDGQKVLAVATEPGRLALTGGLAVLPELPADAFMIQG